MNCIIVTPDGSINLQNIEEMPQCSSSESFGDTRNVGQMRITYVLYYSTASQGEPNKKSNVLISTGCACCYASLDSHEYVINGNIYITKHCQIGSSEISNGDCNEEDVQFITSVLQKRSERIGSYREICEVLTHNVFLFAFRNCMIWGPCLFGLGVWYFFSK